MATNTNKEIVSPENGEGILFGWFEARLAQHRSEVDGTWDTPEGRAIEATYGHLGMALEAMGYDLNAVEPLYIQFAATH